MVVVDSGMPDSSWCPGGEMGEGKRVNGERKGARKERREGVRKTREGARKERREEALTSKSSSIPSTSN